MSVPSRLQNVMQTCSNCGQYVSPSFARVFGDNDDAVHACPNCASMRTIMEAGAAGQV